MVVVAKLHPSKSKRQSEDTYHYKEGYRVRRDLRVLIVATIVTGSVRKIQKIHFRLLHLQSPTVFGIHVHLFSYLHGVEAARAAGLFVCERSKGFLLQQV